MRKLSFLFVAFFMLSGLAIAQDPAKVVKSGIKALGKYTADNSDVASIQEAQAAAEEAIKMDENLDAAWLLKGNSYAAEVNALAKQVTEKRNVAATEALANGGNGMADLSSVIIPEEAINKAEEAYMMAYQKAEKSSGKKKAIDGLMMLSSSLSTLGNAMLDGNRYGESYLPLKKMIEVDDFFIANNEKPLFENEESRTQQKYIMAVVSRQSGNMEDSKALHKELYDMNYPEAGIYAGYSQILMAEGDDVGGVAALNKGREMFPDNSDILFAEINYYIQKQDLKTLESKLQEAIAKEPDNVGLYNALGNVYMNLSQAPENAAMADEYGKKAVDYYQKTLDREAKNVDATYSIGSLYFNKAVGKANEMNNLGTSKADQARYDELNTEISDLFEKALPYFVTAEEIDPNDRNTIIALKEIYARQNNFEKSKMYKERLDKL